MVAIKFADRQTQSRAIDFLVDRFSGGFLRTGEVIVPVAAVVVLARENFSFTVIGKVTHDQMTVLGEHALA